MIESKALTGDDLVLADVWAVAVDHAPVEIADSARERMRAARELVERAVHGKREHTYGVNTGFGRFVSRSIPEELTDREEQRPSFAGIRARATSWSSGGEAWSRSEPAPVAYRLGEDVVHPMRH